VLHNSNNEKTGESVFGVNYGRSARPPSWVISCQKPQWFGYMYVADSSGSASVSLTLWVLTILILFCSQCWICIYTGLCCI